MLQNKDIAKIQEIKIHFNDTWISPEFFKKYLDLFKINKASKIFKSVKETGVPFGEVINLLLILPFTISKTINSLYTSKFTPSTKGKKDVYYRALSNQKINWRNILLLFVKRYLSLDQRLKSSTDNIKCLIFDDTDIEKSGKIIEGVSKIYNHVTKTYVFGYKLFVAGYWNGSVFIPVDFSFHREYKDNKKKKYGLSKKEYKNQKKTKRDIKQPVIKRYKELNAKKTDILIQMFKRIKKRKIDVDYILFDSWFTSILLISKLLKISCKINIIGMYKYNSKVKIEGTVNTIKQLRKQKKNLKRSRKYNFYFLNYTGLIDDVEVKVFIIRKGKRGAWHTIISTDTTLNFNQMMSIYKKRWTIEVFFKEAKQLLGLGTSQSTNFDVQVAQTTINMIQYLLVSLKFRQQAYESIDGLFKDIKQDFIEHKLDDRIMLAIVELIAVLEFIIEDFNIEATISKLIHYNEKFDFLIYLQEKEKNCKLAA
ncbi:MAG: transposase [Bacteroidota bacterium]|nr:transposase [Bacteroidota bacterium]